MGAVDADGGPAARSAWCNVCRYRQHGARPWRRAGPRRTGAGRVPRRLHVRMTLAHRNDLMSPKVLFDFRGKRVFVAGHRGLAGSAIVRRLAQENCEVLTADRRALDLTDQQATETWLGRARPDAIFLAAGLVGGIHANNTYPADFIANNLAIALNVIRCARTIGVKKLLALGSSCIYPKLAEQPMSEQMLLTGSLEPTNQWYPVAKIAAIKLCDAHRRQHGEDFISVMP